MKNIYGFAYQSIVNAKTNRVIASELLLRQVDGITLNEFLEKPDLFVVHLKRIVQLKFEAIGEVLKSNPSPFYFLNFSPAQILEPNFISYLKEFRHHAKDVSVAIEVTEDSPSESWERVLEVLGVIRGLGFMIVIDDFGTGHSNFNQTFESEPSIVKLDMSLIRNSQYSSRAKRYIFSLVRLFHEIDMKVVIEGIEDAEMHSIAVESNADYLQGYYISKPELIKL